MNEYYIGMLMLVFEYAVSHFFQIISESYLHHLEFFSQSRNKVGVDKIWLADDLEKMCSESITNI